MVSCVQVVAVDQDPGGLSATAQINITVLDYNDNAPQFPRIPTPLLIPEGDYSVGTPGDVFTIVPTDADIADNGDVTVSFASPHPLFTFREVRQRNKMLTLDVETNTCLCSGSQDGTLLAVGPLDRESKETYELVVKASDRGSPQREVRPSRNEPES